MKKLIKYFLSIYQKLNIVPNRCRYYPSCSQYALEAVDKYGTSKGLLLSVMRICRCNQFFPGGHDPVR